MPAPTPDTKPSGEARFEKFDISFVSALCFDYICRRYGEFYRFSPEIPSYNLRCGCGTGPYYLHAEKRHNPRPPRPCIPLLRPARRRKNHLRPHLRKGHQLPRTCQRRGLQPVRIVPQLQRGPQFQYPRTRCRLKQLGRRHPIPHRPDPHPASGRPVQRIYHRRGPHALGAGLQRLPQDPRGTARTCGLYPRHYRKAQDNTDDPVAVPDIRIQPHTRRGQRPLPAICRRTGGRNLRRRVDEPHRSEGLRRNARRPVDLRQGRLVLRHQPHLQGDRPRAECPRLRCLLQECRHDPRG